MWTSLRIHAVELSCKALYVCTGYLLLFVMNVYSINGVACCGHKYTLLVLLIDDDLVETAGVESTQPCNVGVGPRHNVVHITGDVGTSQAMNLLKQITT